MLAPRFPHLGTTDAGFAAKTEIDLTGRSDQTGPPQKRARRQNRLGAKTGPPRKGYRIAIQRCPCSGLPNDGCNQAAGKIERSSDRLSTPCIARGEESGKGVRYQ
jgi:hypothetical protein